MSERIRKNLLCIFIDFREFSNIKLKLINKADIKKMLTKTCKIKRHNAIITIRFDPA